MCVIYAYYRVIGVSSSITIFTLSSTNQPHSIRKKNRFEVVLWLQLWRSCGFRSRWLRVCWLREMRYYGVLLDQRNVIRTMGAYLMDQSENYVVQKYGRTPYQSPLSFVANNHTYITPTHTNSINYITTACGVFANIFSIWYVCWVCRGLRYYTTCCLLDFSTIVDF